MFDFKLNNACNHRIINEPLEIKGSYPNYYATLKRPVFGNDLSLKIVDEDNLFVVKPKYLSYELGNDHKTIKLNKDDIEVDVREQIYPKHSYYATYYTNQTSCPKCIYGTSTTNDIYINVVGRPILTSGFELTIQKIKKILITALQANLFDQSYGSELPNLIGKPKTILTLLKAQNTIQEAIDYIKIQQMNNYDLLSDDEKIIKIDNFQVIPSTDPKTLKFTFEVYNLSGKNVNIGVTI